MRTSLGTKFNWLAMVTRNFNGFDVLSELNLIVVAIELHDDGLDGVLNAFGLWEARNRGF